MMKICKHYNTLWIKDALKIDDLLSLTYVLILNPTKE